MQIKSPKELVVYQKAYCEILAPSNYALLAPKCKEVGAMLGAMINDPAPFLIKPRPPTSDL